MVPLNIRLKSPVKWRSLSNAPNECQVGLAPPYFPAEGRLPKNIDLVQANVDLQTREEKEFKLTLNAQNGLNNTPPCCKSLHVSLFFDGTNNNEKASAEAKRPNPSNIARLYHTALEDIDSGYYSYYIPGVGTAFPEIGELDFSDAGLRYATGGEARINWALLRIVDAVRHTLTGERLGDSEAKGLAQSLSRDMAGKAKVNKPIRTMRRQVVFRHLFAPLRARAKTHQPKILKIKLFIYGFSRGAAEARAFVNWLTDILDAALLQEKTPLPTLLGWPIAVEFLGLCDTVASVGIARIAPGFQGHMAWADDNLALPDESQFPDLFSAAAILSPLTSSVCAFRSILSDARREITPPVPLRWFTLVFTLTWAAAMPGGAGEER